MPSNGDDDKAIEEPHPSMPFFGEDQEERSSRGSLDLLTSASFPNMSHHLKTRLQTLHLLSFHCVVSFFGSVPKIRITSVQAQHLQLLSSSVQSLMVPLLHVCQMRVTYISDSNSGLRFFRVYRDCVFGPEHATISMNASF